MSCHAACARKLLCTSGAAPPLPAGTSQDPSGGWFSITFDKPGVYLYVCTPHKVMGMIALVVVGGDVSNKDAISKVKMMGRGKKKLAELLGQI